MQTPVLADNSEIVLVQMTPVSERSNVTPCGAAGSAFGSAWPVRLRLKAGLEDRSAASISMLLMAAA